MDVVMLSRLQFAVTVFFHFIFVPLTLGLVVLLAIMETLYVRTGNEVYKRMVKFWGKLFLINFVLGVVTGITLEFQFGTNWSRYSEYVGDIFGSLLAIEATAAFFLESTFLAVWAFGWERVSKKVHLTAIWLVAIASNLSALWIILANGWMQNPVGYVINPFRPVFRAGLNYQLADYSFIRASAGQGYRNPSINEKYLRKDIGGVGIYPNLDIKPEKGYNAELGFKQGYKIGNFQGFVDVAGFYTEYRDMVEFQFGLFNNADYSMINSISDAIQMVTDGKGFGIGAQFHNVSKAQIYGMEISTNGVYDFNKNTKLFYNLGYVYTEPRDADYKERNEIEDLYTDALQMKE